ncbi:MAG: ATP-binding protein [Methanospirillum sp.]
MHSAEARDVRGRVQQVHTKEKYLGSGIGLGIGEQILDRHGGTIRVESRPGVGSTFSVTQQAA